MFNQQLFEARLGKRWSSEEASQKVGVSEKTYRRWEAGTNIPQVKTFGLLLIAFGEKPGKPAKPEDLGYNLKNGCIRLKTLEEVCQPTQAEVSERPKDDLVQTHEDMLESAERSQTSLSEIASRQEDASALCVSKPEIESGASGLLAPKLWHFIVSDPTRHFWQIAHTDYGTPDEMIAAIQAVIKDMNMTTGDNITRRDALCELASIPLITLGQTSQLHARRYEEMLRFCTAALPSCWELYRGSDPIGTQHAFKCCSTYVPLLETMAHDSSVFRKQALDLAAQYALLKTWLGWSYVGTRGTVPIAMYAMNLSEETEDILLQLSAYTKLGWAYFADRQYPNALEIMQKGEAVLKRYQRRLVLPEHVVGGFYSTYSLVQVNNGLSPDTTLGIATNSAPGREDRGFIQFTRSSQLLEAAWICTTKGDSPQAIDWISKRMDLKTLAPLSGVSQSERGRIETVNVLTRALLQSNERDMGEIIRIWKVGMEGAQTLRSEGRYEEAIANFEAMHILWPKEPAIRALMPMTSHW